MNITNIKQKNDEYAKLKSCLNIDENKVIILKINEKLEQHYKTFDRTHNNKFINWCEENGFEDDSIITELVKNAEPSDCILLEYDNNFPSPEKIEDKKLYMFNTLISMFNSINQDDNDNEEKSNENNLCASNNQNIYYCNKFEKLYESKESANKNFIISISSDKDRYAYSEGNEYYRPINYCDIPHNNLKSIIPKIGNINFEIIDFIISSSNQIVLIGKIGLNSDKSYVCLIGLLDTNNKNPNSNVTELKNVPDKLKNNNVKQTALSWNNKLSLLAVTIGSKIYCWKQNSNNNFSLKAEYTIPIEGLNYYVPQLTWNDSFLSCILQSGRQLHQFDANNISGTIKHIDIQEISKINCLLCSAKPLPSRPEIIVCLDTKGNLIIIDSNNNKLINTFNLSKKLIDECSDRSDIKSFLFYNNDILFNTRSILSNFPSGGLYMLNLNLENKEILTPKIKTIIKYDNYSVTDMYFNDNFLIYQLETFKNDSDKFHSISYNCWGVYKYIIIKTKP